MIDAFNKAFVSAVAFRDRFHLFGGLDFKLRKTWEEVFEFFQAVEKYQATQDTVALETIPDWEKELRDNILAEFSDIIYAGFAPLIEMGFTLDEIQTALYNKALHNDAKTLETHELRDGYVRRKNEKSSG